ncbi:MAG: TIGR03086 family protein [Chloroflexi bacterium]|nr:TIGR03086 family protein [Chloroflexota bacterium]
MDDIARCERALEQASAVVAALTQSDLDKPTPCTDWDVRGLLGHMIDVCTRFSSAASGQPPPTPSQDGMRTAEQLAAAYLAASSAALSAFRTPGALERTLTLRIGEIPASQGVKLVTADQLIHTWDLSIAIGRSCALDAELAALSLELMRQILKPGFRGPGKGFAEEVPCPPDAPVQDRLLAFSGRQP